MEKMQVNSISIRNVLGIKLLEVRPGKINSIDGPNGAGKTSFLSAIKAAVGGGHDATLLREGEDEGEIVLVFENGMRLSKVIGKEKSKVTIKDAEGLTMKKSASFLKGAVDLIGMNPIRLLTAPTKERVNILLDSVPLDLPVKELAAIGVSDTPNGRHPIEFIDEVRKGFFEKRADKNRDVKAKQGMIDQIRESTSFIDHDEDYSALVDSLVKQKFDKETAFDKAILDEKDGYVKACRDNEDGLEAYRQETQDHADALIRVAEESHKAKVEELREDLDENRDKICLSFTPELSEFTEKIATAKEKAEAQTKIEVAKGYIEDGEADIEILKSVSKSFSDKLDAVDRIKKDMLAEFPIKGLEIKGGDIYLDGVIFDNVNESRRISFALELAAIRQSELPLVCVDGLEALDTNSFKLFCDMASKTDMQFFVTRVNDDDRMSLHIMDEDEVDNG